jgi:hypothetical protein
MVLLVFERSLVMAEVPSAAHRFEQVLQNSHLQVEGQVTRNVSIILRQSDERINEESPARHLGFWAC